MEEKFETLGQIIDSIDSLTCGLSIPMPAEIHLQALRSSLPEKVEELKKAFIEITGENPWD